MIHWVRDLSQVGISHPFISVLAIASLYCLGLVVFTLASWSIQLLKQRREGSHQGAHQDADVSPEKIGGSPLLGATFLRPSSVPKEDGPILVFKKGAEYAQVIDGYGVYSLILANEQDTLEATAEQVTASLMFRHKTGISISIPTAKFLKRAADGSVEHDRNGYARITTAPPSLPSLKSIELLFIGTPDGKRFYTLRLPWFDPSQENEFKQYGAWRCKVSIGAIYKGHRLNVEQAYEVVIWPEKPVSITPLSEAETGSVQPRPESTIHAD
jgi:hypothetical protein